MKTVFILFDSLTKNTLSLYGGRVKLPNIERLAKKSISFETHYCGSLPCMPARRDIHTGRMHFLHCSWGPLEPFDKSFVSLLRQEKGTHSHLITDHQHYFEQGGTGYHNQYDVWEFFRGQEGDIFKSHLSRNPQEFSERYHTNIYPLTQEPLQNINHKTNHILNREYYIKEEKDFPLVKCFNAALEFLDNNHSTDNWFLHLECFDPHEPFYAAKRFREMAGINENSPIADWPPYGTLSQPELSEELIKNYDALLLMCDEYLGKILDKMDQYKLWDDTALILTTDHGLLFGEHDLWGKSRESYYEGISHIPLFIYHPEYQDRAGTSRFHLTQTPDLMPTILEFFNVPLPTEVTGYSLLPLFHQDNNQDKTVIFGMFGGAVGITDGTYVYYRYPRDLYDENTLNEYTLMPQHMRNSFSIAELQTAELVPPFSFSQGVSLLKIKALNSSKRVPLGIGYIETESALYNLVSDPQQVCPIDNPKKIKFFQQELIKHFQKLDAPIESYERFQLFS